MKIVPYDWTKYDFDKSFQYLQKYGLRSKYPSLNSDWMKILIHTQIYGGVGTINEMISYAGINIKYVVPSYKYNLADFLQYYHIIEQVKRLRRGGRVFEITKFGEDLIDWTAKN